VSILDLRWARERRFVALDNGPRRGGLVTLALIRHIGWTCRDPYYNTNAQVRGMERLVERLPKRGLTPQAASAPRKRPRTAKQLNEEQTAELIAGYRAGAKLRELGKLFGIHPETAGRILRRHGVQMRPTGLSPDQEAEAGQLYAGGLSLKRIGQRLGVDGETVRKVLIKHGIRLRDHHGRWP
jgi:DNA-binding CsgD family transcriptional regulator